MSPPWAFPKNGERLPKLVRTWMPSTQKPDRMWKPEIYSPFRISLHSTLARAHMSQCERGEEESELTEIEHPDLHVATNLSKDLS